MAEYMTELATALGLNWYPKQGPFGQKNGAVIGAKDGYVVAAGPTKAANGQRAIGVLIRFREGSPPEQIKEILKAKKLKPSNWELQVGSDSLLFRWAYSFRKPNAGEVADFARQAAESLKNLALPLDPHCEMCHGPSSQTLTLCDGVLGYFCETCQQRTRQDLDSAALEYERKSVNLPRGLAYGVAAALLGALAWGGVAYGINRIFLWGAIIIGFLVAWAVTQGMGKVERAGQALVFLLTVASVLAGDIFFYCLTLAKEAHVPLSLGVLRIVLANFWELETEESGIFSVVFGLAGAILALVKMRKPKFSVKFERLGQPAT